MFVLGSLLLLFLCRLPPPRPLPPWAELKAKMTRTLMATAVAEAEAELMATAKGNAEFAENADVEGC